MDLIITTRRRILCSHDDASELRTDPMMNIVIVLIVIIIINITGGIQVSDLGDGFVVKAEVALSCWAIGASLAHDVSCVREYPIFFF